MRIRNIALALCAVLSLPVFGAAQTIDAPPAISRTLVAATRLVVVSTAPLYFKAVSVTLQPDEASEVAADDGFLYQTSGSTEVARGGGSTKLDAGEALFLARGEMAALKAGGGEPPHFLHFLILPAVDLGRRTESAHRAASQIYRTPTAIQNLRPGAYDLTLTRVIFPARTPSTPPHHRSGAALYYVVSGVGANTFNGRTHTRGPGSVVYEPQGLVHQWGNPGDRPLIALVFNISPEGAEAVVSDAPARQSKRTGVKK